MGVISSPISTLYHNISVICCYKAKHPMRRKISAAASTRCLLDLRECPHVSCDASPPFDLTVLLEPTTCATLAALSVYHVCRVNLHKKLIHFCILYVLSSLLYLSGSYNRFFPLFLRRRSDASVFLSSFHSSHWVNIITEVCPSRSKGCRKRSEPW